MTAWKSVKELAADVSSAKTSALELVEESLRRIKTAAEYDAVISVIEERAIERAKEIDKQVASGSPVGRLAGVPFIAKDNFLTFGSETTAGSAILKGFKAPYQATAVERLEAEGAICVAKANLDAFAHGASTENSDFKITKNPHDKTRVPGGSSGGSAAVVALELTPFALGTDTGGSIRQPSSFCGVVGLKPTYGLVSRSGVVAMASSTDVIGPIASSIDDTALVLDVMAGTDPLDSTSIPADELGYTDLKSDITGLKIGLVKEYMSDTVQPEVAAAVRAAADKLKAAGAEIVEVSLPSLPLALACYYVLCPAEVSSNLSRYDGQRYGYSDTQAKTLDESYEKSRSHGFGHEAKRRIMIGTYVLSSGYYDAYYKRAQQLRTKLIEEFDAVFKEVQYVMGPVAPTTAFKIGEHSSNPLEMYLQDIMTVAANLVGIPAISIPVKTKGLPIGVQIMAPQRYDRQLLGVSKHVEGVSV